MSILYCPPLKALSLSYISMNYIKKYPFGSVIVSNSPYGAQYFLAYEDKILRQGWSPTNLHIKACINLYLISFDISYSTISNIGILYVWDKHSFLLGCLSFVSFLLLMVYRIFQAYSPLSSLLPLLPLTTLVKDYMLILLGFWIITKEILYVNPHVEHSPINFSNKLSIFIRKIENLKFKRS